jgi:hypothetical protein
MDDLPDYTMSLPFPTLSEEVPEDFAARLHAAIAAFQQDLREQEHRHGVSLVRDALQARK